MTVNKKLSIICFSGEFDKAIAMFTLASGAAAVNYEVNLFFTFWGLNIIKKKPGRTPVGKGLIAKLFGFLMGGLNNLPLSRFNFGGVSPVLMTKLSTDRNVATLPELINASIALNVNFYACEMSINILGLKKEEFIPELKEILGVPGFLEIARDGETIFI